MYIRRSQPSLSCTILLMPRLPKKCNKDWILPVFHHSACLCKKCLKGVTQQRAQNNVKMKGGWEMCERPLWLFFMRLALLLHFNCCCKQHLLPFSCLMFLTCVGLKFKIILSATPMTKNENGCSQRVHNSLTLWLKYLTLLHLFTYLTQIN